MYLSPEVKNPILTRKRRSKMSFTGLRRICIAVLYKRNKLNALEKKKGEESVPKERRVQRREE